MICNALAFVNMSMLNKGKEWRHRQLKKITDRVFDRVTNQPGKAELTFEDLYIAVLLVYK